MTKAMITYYYEFEDGYFLYSMTGKMDRRKKALAIQKHGKILVERKA